MMQPAGARAAITLSRQWRRNVLVHDDPVPAALLPDGRVSSRYLHVLPVFLVDGAVEGIAGPGDVSAARHSQVVVWHE